MKSILTDEQQAILEEVNAFLLEDDSKYFLISAPAGTGKTFLAKYLYTNVYLKNKQKSLRKFKDFVFTATTNKAAGVLDANVKGAGTSATTIHSFLGLTVSNDYSTGMTKLSATNKTVLKTNTIIIVDECSMIDRNLFKFINDYTYKCKIIFIGDDKQLPPVGNTISPVFDLGLKVHRLSKVIRSGAHEEITEVCNQLRETVDTSVFKDIQIKGNIKYCTPAEFREVVENHFKQPYPEGKILTYTNKRCVEYNEFIAMIRGQEQFLTKDNYYICNNPIVYCGAPKSFIANKSKATILYNNEEIKIKDISEKLVDYATGLEYYECSFYRFMVTSQGDWKISDTPDENVMKVPAKFEEYLKVIKYLAKEKNWREYFRLKEEFVDLRYRDASTVHKSQGSTLDKVFIDLTDLGTCRQTSVFSRLLYVALSRAKEEIYLVGNLPSKYGKVCTITS